MVATLKVRVYNVGCGDCILLTIPDAGQMRHVLIDCGNFYGDSAGDLGTALKNVQAVLDDEGHEQRLDLVVATHEHWDHIKGFESALTLFKQLKIDRIWLSIAMKPGLKGAQGLHALRAYSLGLWSRLSAHGATFGLEDQFMLENCLSTKESAKVVREDLPKHNHIEPTYVYRGMDNDPNGVQTDRMTFTDHDHIKLHILAPEYNIDDAYLSHAHGLLSALAAAGVAPQTAAAAPAPDDSGDVWPANLSKSEFRQLRAGLVGSMFSAAKALRTGDNNTSVVLLLEWYGLRLLFPGDAEWEGGPAEGDLRGSWPVMWRDAAVHELLKQRLDFLKVGHHGSRNATPFDLDDQNNAINEILNKMLPNPPAASAAPRAAVTTEAGRIKADKNEVPYRRLMNELAARVTDRATYDPESGLQPWRTDREAKNVLFFEFAPSAA
jgi:beta-lactamase superfamily II metal-dependent hydrolase